MTIEDRLLLINNNHFYSTGGGNASYVELEAYHEDFTLVIINIHIETIRDEFYGVECLEHIRENDLWQNDRVFIQQYFYNHLNEIELLNK